MNFSIDLFDICNLSVQPTQEYEVKGMSYMGESFFFLSLINILKLEGNAMDGAV